MILKTRFYKNYPHNYHKKVTNPPNLKKNKNQLYQTNYCQSKNLIIQ